MNKEIRKLEQGELNEKDLFEIWKKVDVQALGHSILLSMQKIQRQPKGEGEGDREFSKTINLDEYLLKSQEITMRQNYGDDLVNLTKEMIASDTKITAEEAQGRLKNIF